MCENKFNAVFRREHHCRSCGYIFCQDQIDLIMMLFKPPQGEKKIRFCRRCYDKISQLIADKQFFIDNEDSTLKMTLQKEGNSHLRNTSKYFESVTTFTFTFTSSKSIIAKQNEVEQIQEEDDTLLEINQQREDKSEFFEKINYQFIRKEWLLIRKNMLYIVLKPNKTYEKVIEF
ncbi:unnamed protein product [Paramecium pentaurelia]|uniref:FYVE-type domain-containing protein n=1 Tax=Paramecium pentaurelia TaxID=43138 RepID=A0A8S1UPZ7_9CILI|nr:unnamed protein product [Paramecium pentaurelia]